MSHVLHTHSHTHLTNRVSLIIIEFHLSLTCLCLQLAIEIIMIAAGSTLLAVRAKGNTRFLIFIKGKTSCLISCSYPVLVSSANLHVTTWAGVSLKCCVQKYSDKCGLNASGLQTWMLWYWQCAHENPWLISLMFPSSCRTNLWTHTLQNWQV